jgi:acyl-CoA reductase-like NAD-dependent aldehyde dehydrogenase
MPRRYTSTLGIDLREIIRLAGRRGEQRRRAGGFYVQPTIFEGDNKMRIFQEEIFGPWCR